MKDLNEQEAGDKSPRPPVLVTAGIMQDRQQTQDESNQTPAPQPGRGQGGQGVGKRPREEQAQEWKNSSSATAVRNALTLANEQMRSWEDGYSNNHLLPTTFNPSGLPGTSSDIRVDNNYQMHHDQNLDDTNAKDRRSIHHRGDTSLLLSSSINDNKDVEHNAQETTTTGNNNFSNNTGSNSCIIQESESRGTADYQQPLTPYLSQADNATNLLLNSSSNSYGQLLSRLLQQQQEEQSFGSTREQSQNAPQALLNFQEREQYRNNPYHSWQQEEQRSRQQHHQEETRPQQTYPDSNAGTALSSDLYKPNSEWFSDDVPQEQHVQQHQYPFLHTVSSNQSNNYITQQPAPFDQSAWSAQASYEGNQSSQQQQQQQEQDQQQDILSLLLSQQTELLNRLFANNTNNGSNFLLASTKLLLEQVIFRQQQPQQTQQPQQPQHTASSYTEQAPVSPSIILNQQFRDTLLATISSLSSQNLSYNNGTLNQLLYPSAAPPFTVLGGCTSSSNNIMIPQHQENEHHQELDMNDNSNNNTNLPPLQLSGLFPSYDSDSIRAAIASASRVTRDSSMTASSINRNNSSSGAMFSSLLVPQLQAAFLRDQEHDIFIHDGGDKYGGENANTSNNLTDPHAAATTTVSSLTSNSSNREMQRYLLGVQQPAPTEATSVKENDSNSVVMDKETQQAIRDRPFTSLGLKGDEDHLSGFQCFLRKECIEIFKASPSDVHERKRSRKVILDQVGLRCRFCAHLSSSSELRVGRSSSFPSSLDRIYQSVAMMIRDHFSKCKMMLPEIREKYDMFMSGNKDGKSKRRKKGFSDLEVKLHWANAASALGMFDAGDEGIKMNNTDMLVKTNDEETS